MGKFMPMFVGSACTTVALITWHLWKRKYDQKKNVDAETRAARAKAAVVRLVLGSNVQAQMTVAPLKGINEAAFKVSQTNPPLDFFVKVLPRGEEQNDRNRQFTASSVEYSCLMGEASLGPSVIGADEEAIVQVFVEARWLPTWHDWSQQPEGQKTPTATYIGEFIAALHKVPIDASTPLAPRCFYNWHYLPDRIKSDERVKEGRDALLEVYHYIDSGRSNTGGVGAQKVFMHGDLHMENLLLQKDGRLLAVDLELAGAGPRAADLAFFFWHWDWLHKGGEGSYPSAIVRQTIVASYLRAAGFSSEQGDVHELLWEVECEVLRVAMSRVTECHKPSTVMLPLMRDALLASESDTTTKSNIVEQGILSVARAQAVKKGLRTFEEPLHTF